MQGRLEHIRLGGRLKKLGTACHESILDHGASLQGQHVNRVHDAH
jgi:hypothetical protein